jgi:uncharacterized protein YjiK
MSIGYINVAVFMISSLTYHNSRRINIEKDTTPCTMDLQKTKLANLYQRTNCGGNGIAGNVGKG